MKTALITTTIRVPTVLETYRSINKDVSFFVTGDRKTPHNEVRSLVEGLGNAVYYSDTEQEKLGYESSEIIGWNKIMRRNIALLEAIKHGADLIITIDDDNIPPDENYFDDFISLLSTPYTGPRTSSETRWFNVGELMVPRVYHRGFPYEWRHKDLQQRLSAVRDAKVGVAAGMWLGDPDIDAMERITNRPIVHQISEMLRNGLIVDNTHFAPFDSQNTAYVRELAPLMMVLTGVGRYDDIWASFIAQRVMMTTDYCCHYGAPLVWQERNEQSLWQNLKDEIFGMEHTEQFCADLLAAELGEGSVLEKLERLHEHLAGKDYIPPVVNELGRAWCRDVRSVL
jgi:Reversibly glycosylated polypeptide